MARTPQRKGGRSGSGEKTGGQPDAARTEGPETAQGGGEGREPTPESPAAAKQPEQPSSTSEGTPKDDPAGRSAAEHREASGSATPSGTGQLPTGQTAPTPGSRPAEAAETRSLAARPVSAKPAESPASAKTAEPRATAPAAAAGGAQAAPERPADARPTPGERPQGDTTRTSGPPGGPPPGGTPPPDRGPSSGGFGRALVAGVVGAVLVLVLLALMPEGLRRNLSGAPGPELQQRITALEAALDAETEVDLAPRLDELEGRFAELAAIEAPDVTPLEQRLALLEEQVETIAETPPPAAVPPEEMEAVAERLDAIERRFAALEEWPADLAELPDLAPVVSRLEDYAARIEALEAATPTDELFQELEGRIDEALEAAAGPADLARLEERLEEAFAGIEAALGERLESAQPDLEPIESRLAAIEDVLPDQADRQDLLAGRIDELAELTGALGRQIESLEGRLATADDRSAQAVAVTLATTQIREALALAQPFDAPLATLQELAGDDAAVAEATETLRPVAGTGVASMGELRQRFRPAADEAMHRALAPQGEGLLEQATDRVLRLVTIRRVEEVEDGTGTHAVVGRAGARLEAGDLAGAADEIELLDGPPRAAFEDWLDDARTRIAAERAVLRLEEHALALLGTAP